MLWNLKPIFMAMAFAIILPQGSFADGGRARGRTARDHFQEQLPAGLYKSGNGGVGIPTPLPLLFLLQLPPDRRALGGRQVHRENRAYGYDR